jgi:hypothetical protein
MGANLSGVLQFPIRLRSGTARDGRNLIRNGQS